MWHSNESYVFFKHLYTQETESLFLFHKFIRHYIDTGNDIELKINETARPPLVWRSYLIFLKLVHNPDDCNIGTDGWMNRQITNATYQQNSKQQLCMRTKFSENLDLQHMTYLKNG